MKNFDKAKKVLVTGGTGYLASWIIKMLLDEGVIVHTTVRNPKDNDKIAHLKKIDKSNQLKIFKADLLETNGFKEAMQGCEFVIHTASPFFMAGFKDPEKELIAPAKQGTQNVLNTAKETPGVKRVVLTSSIAAIYGDCIDINNVPNKIFTENEWNNTSSVNHLPYSYSKTVAENSMIQFLKREGWSTQRYNITHKVISHPFGWPASRDRIN